LQNEEARLLLWKPGFWRIEIAAAAEDGNMPLNRLRRPFVAWQSTCDGQKPGIQEKAGLL